MTSRLLASLILLSSVAGAGCHRDVAPTTGPEPSEGAPEGSAPVAPRSTATPPAAPATFATRAEAVDASSTGQLALAALFVEAADTANSAQLELALRALGRTLGELRAGQYDEALVDAVRRLASPGRVAATTRVDGRTIVPAVELLLDIGDGAAIERLTEPYQAGAFAPLFRDPAPSPRAGRGQSRYVRGRTSPHSCPHARCVSMAQTPSYPRR